MSESGLTYPPKPQKAAHEAAFDLCAKIASAVQAVVPPNCRVKATISIDNGKVKPEDCSVEFRPAQGRRVP